MGVTFRNMAKPTVDHAALSSASTMVPISTSAMAHFHFDHSLEAKCMFVSDFGDMVNMSVKYGDNIAIPRQMARGTGKDLRTSNFIGAISCKVPPRSEDQASAITKSVGLLKSGRDHVIEAPTGWGKTYVGSSVAAAMGHTTLIVVTKQDLMDSWRNTLINLIGVPADQIGLAQADKLDYKGKRFVIGMVQSLTRPGKYDSDFWSYFGLVLFDETHRMAADTFSQVCQLSPSLHRLGLSATPKRTDGKTPVITNHIGPVLVRGMVIPMKPEVRILYTGWSIPKGLDLDPSRMSALNKLLTHSDMRNNQIVDFVTRAVMVNRTTVVMADSLDHLKRLQMLIAAKIGGEHTGFYVGGLSKAELAISTHKKVILATYGMCAEGTDCPWWDTLVLASPRANVKQPVGRVLRSKEGKMTPVVLDLVDNGPIMGAFMSKRLKTYYELQSQIKWLNKPFKTTQSKP